MAKPERFTKVGGKKVYESDPLYQQTLQRRTTPISKIAETAKSQGYDTSGYTDRQLRDLSEGRTPDMQSDASKQAQRYAIKEKAGATPSTLSTVNKAIVANKQTGLMQGNALAGLKQVTADQAQDKYTKDTEGAIKAAQDLKMNEDETPEQFMARQLAAYKNAAEIKSKGEQAQYAIASAEAQKNASQPDLQSEFSDIMGEFKSTKEYEEAQKQRTETEKLLAEQKAEVEGDIQREAQRAQEQISRQQKAQQAGMTDRVGIVSNEELKQGMMQAGNTYLEDLARRDDRTMRDMMRQQDKIRESLDLNERAMFDSFVQAKQQQAIEENKAVLERQKAYEDRIVQFAKDNPDYQLDPQALMQGVVQLQEKSKPELSDKLAQYGMDMQQIQAMASQLGLKMDPNAISKTIMTQAFADMGMKMPEGLFEQDQSQFDATIGLLKQLDDFKSPELIRQISAAQQAKNIEDRDYDTALLDAVAGSMQRTQEPTWLEKQQIQSQLGREDYMFKSGMENSQYELKKQIDQRYKAPSESDMKQLEFLASIGINASNIANAPRSPKMTSEISQTPTEFGVNSKGKVEKTELPAGSYVFPDNEPGRGQCAEYVNDLTGTAMGSDLASKNKFVTSKDPIAGGFFVMDLSKYGHTGMVNAVTDDGIYITDYNRNNDEKRRETFIPYDSDEYKKITGFGITPNQAGQATTPDVVDKLRKSIESADALGDTATKKLALESARKLGVYDQLVKSESLGYEDEYNKGLAVANVGNMLYGKTISEGEGQRVQKLIEQGKKLGKSEQDIINDALSSQLGWNIEPKNKDFSENIKSYLEKNTTEEGLRGYDMRGYSNMINRGDKTGVIQKLESDIAKKYDNNALADTAKTEMLINNAKRVQDLAKNVDPSYLGYFDGKKFKIEKKGGLTSEEAKNVQRLESAMVTLSADMRKYYSGSAVTPSEAQFLEPLVASIEDQPEMINIKTQELIDNAINSTNTYRRKAGLPEVDQDTISNIEKRVRLYDGSIKSNQSNVDFLKNYQSGQTTGFDSSDENDFASLGI